MNMIGLVIDAGTLPRRLPSTILNLTEDSLPTIRMGDNTVRKISSNVSRGPDETMQMAKALLKTLSSQSSEKPVIIVLTGDMGVGKTVFTKGLGSALGLHDVDSPTYTIWNQYKTNSPIFSYLDHFDLSMLETTEELAAIGLTDACKPHHLLSVEWGEKIGSITKIKQDLDALIFVIIISDTGADTRCISTYEI